MTKLPPARAQKLDTDVEVESSASQPRIPPYSWYVLIVLTITFALATVDRGIVPVVLESIGKEFSLNDAQLGFLSGLAFGLTYTICGIPAGLLIDRTNRRTFLAAAAGMWSLVTTLGGFAQSYLQLVIARMAVGAAESGMPAAVSMITDYFSERRRPMAIGLYQSGGAVAMGLSFALGGWVAHEWGWRNAFFVVGLPGLLVAVLIFFTVREPRRGAAESQAVTSDRSAPPLRQTLRYLWKTPSAVHIFIGYMITAATIASFWSWITSLLIRVHGLNIRDAGLLIAVGAGLMGFAGAVLGAYISNRLGKRSMKSVLVFVAIAAALLTPLGISMALAPMLPVAIVFMMLVSIVKSSYLGPMQGVLLSVAKVRMRGVTATLLNVLGTLVGYSVGPLITGALSYLLGGGTAIRYALSMLFVLNLWAGLHYWLATRSLSRDLEAAAD